MWLPLLLLVLVVAGFIAARSVASRQRARQLATPLGDHAFALLTRRVPLYRVLPAGLKPALHRAMQRFLADKRFVGCQDLVVTEDMCLIIAAQACLLICGRTHAQFEGFTSVLVYPDAFVVDIVEHDGDVEIVREETRAGESWQGGPVILSWADIEAGLEHPHDGYHVVLHEFAHKLDDENDAGEGLPLLQNLAQVEAWARVLSAEFAKLARGDGRLLDDYGAVSPAQFFAVVTESFFGQAQALAREHPALYAAFRDYYRLDPASWPTA